MGIKPDTKEGPRLIKRFQCDTCNDDLGLTHFSGNIARRNRRDSSSRVRCRTPRYSIPTTNLCYKEVESDCDDEEASEEGQEEEEDQSSEEEPEEASEKKLSVELEMDRDESDTVRQDNSPRPVSKKRSREMTIDTSFKKEEAESVEDTQTPTNSSSSSTTQKDEEERRPAKTPKSLSSMTERRRKVVKLFHDRTENVLFAERLERALFVNSNGNESIYMRRFRELLPSLGEEHNLARIKSGELEPLQVAKMSVFDLASPHIIKQRRAEKDDFITDCIRVHT